MTIAADWLHLPAALPDAASADAARARQASLTKPPGALGTLEDIAIRLAGLQRREQPRVDRVHIGIFAGDHGVVAEGVSAFPQAVTAEMIRNFARGGAAISVLAGVLGATLDVIDLGTVTDVGELPGVIRRRLGPGTANMAKQPAMTAAQLQAALAAGRENVKRALATHAELYIGGEMGIGNTTAATALACAVVDRPPEALAGAGTGLDLRGIAHKAAVIRMALALHLPHCDTPTEILRRLGGLEIAALTGAYIACAQHRLPVLVDGFISSVAALMAERINPGVRQWQLFAHRSAERGHAAVMYALEARPLLDLGMRLGEGSGAAVAVPLLRLACELHAGMATFAEASVSEKLA